MSSLSGYKILDILTPYPQESGGRALNENFRKLADGYESGILRDGSRGFTSPVSGATATVGYQLARLDQITAAQVGSGNPYWNAGNLYGYPLASATPTSGYALVWNGYAWVSSQVAGTGTVTSHSSLTDMPDDTGANEDHDVRYPVKISPSVPTVPTPYSGMLWLDTSQASATGLPTTNVIVSGSILSDVTYYINPTGLDTNAGTVSAPWATLQHGFDYLKSKLIPGSVTVTLQLQNGTYSMPDYLTYVQTYITNCNPQGRIIVQGDGSDFLYYGGYIGKVYGTRKYGNYTDIICSGLLYPSATGSYLLPIHAQDLSNDSPTSSYPLYGALKIVGISGSPAFFTVRADSNGVVRDFTRDDVLWYNGPRVLLTSSGETTFFSIYNSSNITFRYLGIYGTGGYAGSGTACNGIQMYSCQNIGLQQILLNGFYRGLYASTYGAINIDNFKRSSLFIGHSEYPNIYINDCYEGVILYDTDISTYSKDLVITGCNRGIQLHNCVGNALYANIMNCHQYAALINHTNMASISLVSYNNGKNGVDLLNNTSSSNSTAIYSIWNSGNAIYINNASKVLNLGALCSGNLHYGIYANKFSVVDITSDSGSICVNNGSGSFYPLINTQGNTYSSIYGA